VYLLERFVCMTGENSAVRIEYCSFHSQGIVVDGVCPVGVDSDEGSWLNPLADLSETVSGPLIQNITGHPSMH
jgi:hypothetical protein